MRSRRGFSLVEVLVALLVLTIVITTSLAVFVERKRRLEQASETILAYQALANESEFLRRVPYDDLAESTEFQSGKALLAPLQGVQTAVAVEQTTPGIKNVTMTIRWRNGVREARLAIVRVDTGGTPLW